VVSVTVAAAATMALKQPDLLTSKIVITLLLLAALGLLYVLNYFALGILIGSATASYRTTLMLTVSVWVLTGSVTPPAAGLLARALTPTVPLAFVEARLDDDAQLSFANAQIEMGDLFARSATAEAVTTARADARLDPSLQRSVDAVWQRHLQELRARLDEKERELSLAARRRSRLLSAINVISPAAEYLQASAAVAGVGDDMAGRWRDAARQRQVDLERLLFDDRPRLTLQVPAQTLGIRSGGRALVAIQRRPLPQIGSLASFAPPRADLGSRLDDALPHCLILIGYVVALSAAAGWVFGRIRF
jgi:hypothetical protein